MRRALFLAMMGVLLGAPAGAAEKPAPIPPMLVARIDSLIATAAKGIVTIQVKGAVSSGGWRAARLRQAKSADAHTLTLELVATPPPPTQAVVDVLLPVAANARIGLRRGVVSVRVLSGSNEITTQILK